MTGVASAVDWASHEPGARLGHCLVETHDPFGPFGAKVVAEVPTDAMAPAFVKAVADAIGIRINEIRSPRSGC